MDIQIHIDEGFLGMYKLAQIKQEVTA